MFAVLKKFYLCFFFLIFTCFTLQAQYANDWIAYDQPYYKVSIAQTGICRISYQQLRDAGFPVNQVPPAQIQLWRRGRQMRIFIEGGEDGILHPDDKILFYAKSNDGALDTAIYKENSFQPLPEYSLYSDTAAYFLTYAAGQNGKRISETPYQDRDSSISTHWKEHKQIFTDDYNTRKANRDDPKPSYGENGEGWVSRLYRNETAEINIGSIHKPCKTDTNVRFFLRLVGRSSGQDMVQVKLRNNNSGYVRNFGYKYIYDMRILDIQEAFQDNQLLEDNASVSLILEGLSGRFSIAKYAFRYRTKAYLDGIKDDTLIFDADTSGNYILSPADTPSRFSIWNITDFHNQTRLQSQTDEQQQFTISLPPTGQSAETRLLYSNADNRFAPAGIEPVDFRNIQPSAHNYLMVTHESLTGTYNNTTPVREYAAYRASEGAGEHDTLVITTDRLYNQFAYGDKSPVAVRNFARYMLSENIDKTRYLFLIGQGLLVNYQSDGNYYRHNATVADDAKDLVPPMGFPPSDVLYTAGLQNGQKHYEQAIPTSRLPAKSPADIAAYLNKVTEHESIDPPQMWRKKMLFVSGGRTAAEVQNYKNIVSAHKDIAEQGFMGAEGKVIAKNTPGNTRLVDIGSELNRGLSVIETFGHTSASYFDVDIGLVTNPLLNYHNKGKYPLLYVNGCSSGNAFINSSLGENWILTPEKGAIAFFAHADLGYASILRDYGEYFYETLYHDTLFYNKPLGRILQKTNSKYLPPGSESPTDPVIAQVHQMILQGDPAVKLYNPAKPDYQIRDAWLSLHSYTGEKITARSDSFALDFIVKNPGKYTGDSLRVRIERTVNNQQTIQYPVRTYAPVAHTDTLRYKIKPENKTHSGNNAFSVYIDAPDSVDEYDEFNNIAGLRTHFLTNRIKLLSPREFSIVNQDTVSFTAQSSDVKMSERQYKWEIDTSHLFNSPARLSGEISAHALIEFDAPLFQNFPKTDSTVFYWRVKYQNPQNNESDEWEESSFTFIEDSPPGWMQRDFFQFKKNAYDGISSDSAQRTFSFKPTELLVDVSTSGAGADNPCHQTIVNFNNINVIGNCECEYFGYQGIYAYVFDKASLDIQSVDIGNDDFYNCSNGNVTGVRRFVNLNQQEHRNKLSEFIEAIPAEDYVLLFTSGNAYYDSLSASLKDKIAGLGSDSIYSLENGQPYLLLGQKNGEKIQEITGSTDATINLSHLLESKNDQGSIQSTVIGPAKAWHNLFYAMKSRENADDWQINIYGINDHADNALLYSGKPPQMSGMPLDNLHADEHNRIRLEAILKDTASLSPPHLNQWIVTYDPVPEGIIDITAADTTAVAANTIQEGKLLPMQFAFKNISDYTYDADSLSVHHTLSYNNGHDSINQKIKAPAPGETSIFQETFHTKGKTGENKLSTFVNPYLLPESDYNNNILELAPYQVNPDRKNPVMEVTFDGKRIADGEIVSAHPEIAIRVTDDNPYLFKDDTSGINLFLKKPCPNQEDCGFKRIPLHNNPHIRLEPPQSPGNEPYEIFYTPDELSNGMHQLKVNAADASGNKAGIQPYSINFKVVREITVTGFYPYPNPFSESTRFVFTLTGKTIPDQLKVRIMRLSGTVVREIHKHEMQPLHIGHNKSFQWKGTDRNGNKLANGVYLYHVIAKHNGQNIEVSTGSDQNNTGNGWGKLYIMR